MLSSHAAPSFPAPTPSRSSIACAGASDMGRLRKRNEDRFGVFPELGLFVVADGVGGRRAGDVAAEMAVRLLSGILSDATEPADEEDAVVRLSSAVKRVNRRIHETAAQSRDLSGMSTTLAAALILGDRVCLVHAGDSRIYRLREGRLAALTEDHSLVNELIELGILAPDDIIPEQYRSAITRALGAHATIAPDAQVLDFLPGDTLLLCTDGLSSVVEHDGIESILLDHTSVDDAVAELIAHANALGGPDNITVIALRCEP